MCCYSNKYTSKCIYVYTCTSTTVRPRHACTCTMLYDDLFLFSLSPSSLLSPIPLSSIPFTLLSPVPPSLLSLSLPYSLSLPSLPFPLPSSSPLFSLPSSSLLTPSSFSHPPPPRTFLSLPPPSLLYRSTKETYLRCQLEKPITSLTSLLFKMSELVPPLNRCRSDSIDWRVPQTHHRYI